MVSLEVSKTEDILGGLVMQDGTFVVLWQFNLTNQMPSITGVGKAGEKPLQSDVHG